MSIQLKSLRLSKHDEENDMTIGARQGTGRGCGGKRTLSYAQILFFNLIREQQKKSPEGNLKKYFIQQDDDF